MIFPYPLLFLRRWVDCKGEKSRAVWLGLGDCGLELVAIVGFGVVQCYGNGVYRGLGVVGQIKSMGVVHERSRDPR